MQILFENENFKVCYSVGTSDYLLVAFSPMNFMVRDKEDFYAKNIIMTNNLNAITITALRNHWYPKQFMESVLNAIFDIAKKFKTVVSYGVSMGGYAAIKYSKEINASYIISLMPQWSINPNETTDSRYLKEYNQFSEYLESMSIKANEISGKLYLFYDKYFEEDKIQAKNIERIWKDSYPVFTPFTGHTLGYILIGSVFFNQLINIILNDRFEKLKFLIHEKVKEHPLRYQGVIRRALISQRGFLLKIIENLPSEHMIFENKLFIEEAKAILKLQSDRNKAVIMLLRFKYLDGMGILKFIASYNNQGDFIYTAHQNFLCYDLLDEKLVLLHKYELLESIFSIPLRFYSHIGILGFYVNNRFMPLIDIGNKNFALVNQTVLNDLKNYKIQPFLFFRRISDFFVISNGKYHATATPKKTIDFGKDHIKDWERFTVMNIDDQG